MQRARELIRDIFRQTDLVLLALCCIATAFGILMIYSATRYMNTLRLVLVQTGGAVIGIILFFLLSLVDVNELMRKRGWLWLTLLWPWHDPAAEIPLWRGGRHRQPGMAGLPVPALYDPALRDREADLHGGVGLAAGVAAGESHAAERFRTCCSWVRILMMFFAFIL